VTRASWCRKLGLLVLLPLALCGQRYSFKQYGQDEGLSNLDVRALMQDHAGFLWVGTDGGLFRYDGHQFSGYTTAQGLPALQVFAVHQTPDGVIWVGTSEGLASLHGYVFEKSGNDLRGVISLASDAAGTLYAATSLGLAVGKPPAEGGQRRFDVYPPDGPSRTFGLAVDPSGVVWFGCGDGLCTFQAGKIRRMEAIGLPPARWDGLLFDTHGNLWARSPRSLFFLPRGAHRFLKRDEGLPFATRTASVTMDKAGEIYVPTWQGLAHYTPHGWDLLRRTNGLPISAADAFLEDREGSAWIALDGGGLVRWLGYKRWESFTESEGLNHDVVWALSRDSRGTLWAATQAGVSRYLPAAHRWEALPHTLLKITPNLALLPDRDGSLWIGQAPGGVIHLNPSTGRVERLGAQSGFDSDWVYDMALDRAGELWVAGSRGLYRGRRSAAGIHFEQVQLPGTEPPRASTMLADSQGRIWVATPVGLCYLADGRWHRLTTREGLLRDAVTYPAEAPDGSIWVTYRDVSTVTRLVFSGEGMSVRHMDPPGIAGSTKPYFLGFDRRGRLWLGTDHGLNRFDGRAWMHYDKSDGLPIADCDHKAFFADGDGSIWVGTARGLAHFLHPEDIDPRAVDGKVVVTSLQLGRIPAVEGASVPYSRRSLDARFTTLTFVNEESLVFRHRLLGLDENWLETKLREVHYRGLPPGRYRLQVQAATVPGQWLGAAAEIPFRIEPPWWMRWWARAGGLLLLAGILHQVWRWRLHAMLRRQVELERAVADRTQKLAFEHDLALREKARAEGETAKVEKQKVEIERLLWESRQAERVKGEFVTNMSHEVRTPLNTIIGMTDLVMQSPLNDDQAECLRIVQSSSASLLGLMNGVLDFSNVEAGGFRLECASFDFAAMIDEAVQPLAGLAKAKGLRFRTSIAPNFPPLLVGDAARLRQVLANLVDNAIKFTERGFVEVIAAAQTITEGRAVMHIEVRDTGIGIGFEQQTLIFEAFRQVDGSSSRRYSGAGLGLAMCSRLAGLMEGRIWVESTPGAGSTFHFTARLGVAPDQPGRAASSASNAPSTAGLHILLVEDNLVNQKLARRLLEKGGHTVTCAGDGVQALEAFDKDRFDAILMDIQMPVMDGFEATAELRKREKSLDRRTPVLALTANAMQGDRERCLAAGMDGYVTKPINTQELLQAIAGAAAAEKPRSDSPLGAPTC
jgi:signal transduction histidine kinase/ligand-binding sensor domain-containing protein/ActR/RegA family two-component response regulator